LLRTLGRLLGAALRTGALVTIDFVRLIWRALAGEPLSARDLGSLDDAALRRIRFVASCSPSDLDGLDRNVFENMALTLTDGRTRELVRGGSQIAVRMESRVNFCTLALRARLGESRSALRAVRAGMRDVVPGPLLSLLTSRELETRCAGSAHVDVAMLRRHTEYSGISPTAPHVQWFWSLLESFSDDERRAFVRFSWAQERLPASDAEFERTGTRMMIKPYLARGPPDAAFPKADTCFFNLMLPAYSTPEIMRARVLFAIHTDADSMNADAPDPSDREREAAREELVASEGLSSAALRMLGVLQ